MFDKYNKIILYHIKFLVVDGCMKTAVTTHQVCERKPTVVKEKYVKIIVYLNILVLLV